MDYQISGNIRDNIRLKLKENDELVFDKNYAIGNFCLPGCTYEENIVRLMETMEKDVRGMLTDQHIFVADKDIEYILNIVLRKATSMVRYWTNIMA